MRTTRYACALLAILAGGCLLSVGCSNEADKDALAHKDRPTFDPHQLDTSPADADISPGDPDISPGGEPLRPEHTAGTPTDPVSPRPYPIMYRMQPAERLAVPREAPSELSERRPVIGKGAPELSKRRLESLAAPPELSEHRLAPLAAPLESAESPVEPHATHPTAASATDPQQASHTVVKVFYGTDRAAESSADVVVSALPVWMMPTLISAGLTLILWGVALRLYRTRLIRVAALLGLVVTVTLVYFTIDGVYGGKLRFSGENPSELSYGPQRGQQVELGFCEVSIPNDHRKGELEAPSIWRGELSENPEKHVVLLRVERQPTETFFTELHDYVERSTEKGAFVFIHGYNVTFEDAARRTAQLAYDLECAGAPIFDSWPSQGGISSYTIDENNAEWTVPHLKEFLTQVAKQSGAERINLIAHSMGNRALTRALQALSYRADEARPMFHNVILTAPDIDAEVFRRDIAPRIVKTARRVTLYASSNDKALAYSKSVHGFPRAGDSGRDLMVLPGIDTIDVSAVNKSLLGHSYYGSNDTVLADLNELLHGAIPPDRRTWLRPQMLGTLRYWVFEPRNTTATLPGAAGG